MGSRIDASHDFTPGTDPIARVMALRRRISLLRSLAVPGDRLRIGHALAVSIQCAEAVLRERISLLGERLPEPHGFLVLTRVIRRPRILEFLQIVRHGRRRGEQAAGRSGQRRWRMAQALVFRL